MQPKKKILFLSASPRKGGNTDIVLKKIKIALGAGAIGEKLYINDLDFRPCQGCGGCYKDGRCVLEDNLKGVYKKVFAADVIIFGSPIYFGSLSAQAKMFIDRMQPFWVKKVKLNQFDMKRKKGFLILVGGSDRQSFFDNAKQIIKNFFAVINTQYCGELFYADIEKKGEILDFPGIDKQAQQMAEAALTP